MDYFKKLLALLSTEREEDRNQYIRLIAQTSLAERRAAGMAWYPIAIRGTETGRGDYLTLELERTTHHEVAHQFRFGIPAVLFSNHDPAHDRLEGIISHLNGNRLNISLRTDELPDWSRDGKLGIDLLFDENSYEQMQAALKQADSLSCTPQGHLVDILTGVQAPEFQTDTPAFVLPGLNDSQNAAVHKILAARDLAIVHGPPGTGKTTTLVEAIRLLVSKEHKPLLVCAPSNAAVDLLSEKLALAGLNVVRIGNPVRVSDKLMSLTLDSKMAGHPLMKEMKKLKKQAQEFKSMAHKYKRSFGRQEQQQRKLLFDEAHKIMKEVDKTEQYIIQDLTAKAQVIACTLVGANHYTIAGLRFETVVIDEAGQALEPACWIPVLRAQKLIMAGDPYQLPPTVKSAEAARNGLSETLLEKCTAAYPEAVVLLEEQYRMHTHIMGYSSAVFYQSRLQAHPSVAGHLLEGDTQPLAFIDTAGCGFQEKQDGTSLSNSEEAALLLKHLSGLVTSLSVNYNVDNFPSVALISPYRQQVNVLKELLPHYPALQEHQGAITINTVDSFQGQERDIVYISLTRSNEKGEIGFLADTRRMNVAMTRARKKLVVIGDSATLAQSAFYADFISYASNLSAHQSAWEFV